MLQKTGWMLIKFFMLEFIETEEDYRAALKRFFEICEAPQNNDEVKELFVLMDLMEKYERNDCSFS